MGKLQRHVPGPIRPDQDLDVSGIRHQRGSRSVDHLLGRVRTEVNDKIQVRYRTAQRGRSDRSRLKPRDGTPPRSAGLRSATRLSSGPALVSVLGKDSGRSTTSVRPDHSCRQAGRGG